MVVSVGRVRGAVSTQLALAEASGMLRPLLSAVRTMRHHQQDGSGENSSAAPGMSARVVRLVSSIHSDYRSQLASLESTTLDLIHPEHLLSNWGTFDEMAESLESYRESL
eukprot:3497306-Prymnesium_polylepis.2